VPVVLGKCEVSSASASNLPHCLLTAQDSCLCCSYQVDKEEVGNVQPH
jgi:hypothetical protein